MNKKLIYLGIAIIAFCLLGALWIGAGADKSGKPEKQIASAANNIATAAGQAKAPATAKPQAQQPAAQPTQQPGSSDDKADAGDNADQKAKDLPPEELAKIRQELKTAVETKFNNDLGFPLDESKMIAYAQSSLRVKKINDKWDIQIAGTDSDTIAIEYNNQAVEEITKSLQNMPGLTIDQYNAMTKLTATNAEFNNIYQVYKELIQEHVIQPIPNNPVVPAPAVAVPVTNAAAPAALPAVGTKPMPAAIQKTSGTVPAPQGLPAPRYSQPLSR